MKRDLRATWRLIVVVAVVKSYALVWWAGLFWLRRDPSRRVRWRRRIFRSWSASLLAVLGVRLEISGKPPSPPFFMVCNHLSYLDILVLASRLDAVFVARSDLADWPLLGPICRSMDTIFIDRSTPRDVPRVLEETLVAHARGDGVVIFPEGTSTRGAEILPFLPSLLAAPAKLKQPVDFASLSYATAAGEEPADLAVCWWGGMTFLNHFWGLLGLSRIDARLTFGSQPIEGENRKEMALALREAVLVDFTPVVGLSTQ